MNDEKRVSALLVPYRWHGGQYEVFLQKRAIDAPRFPNMYGLFGGGVEKGESVLEALLREIEEELTIRIENPFYFGVYEGRTTLHHVFIRRVPEHFASLVTVREGQYGKFYSFADVANTIPIGTTNKRILHDIELALAQC